VELPSQRRPLELQSVNGNSIDQTNKEYQLTCLDTISDETDDTGAKSELAQGKAHFDASEYETSESRIIVCELYAE